MIKKLKRRFITLATVSLIVLISGIVAGMNIMNYNSVVSNADSTIEMISENQGRLPMYYGYDVDDIFDDIDDLLFNYYEGEGDRDYDDIDSDTNDYSERRFAHGGRAPRGFPEMKLRRPGTLLCWSTAMALQSASIQTGYMQ